MSGLLQWTRAEGARVGMSMKKTKNIIVRRQYAPPQEREEKHLVHMNDRHELYMLLQGKVTFSIEGRLYHVEPYDLLIISNQEIHCVMVDGNYAYERIYIYFRPEYLQQFNTKKYNLLRLFEHIGQLADGNRIDHSIVKKYGLDRDFLQMHEYYAAKQPESPIQLTSLLLKILLDVNRAYDENRQAEAGEDDSLKHNDKIDDIIRYISEHLAEKITLEDLTKNFYLSKYYLCHEFKRVTGFTVFDYIRYKRILNAKMRFQNGQPINEVWRELGYEDYSNFYRTFKKITEMSPKEYIDSLGERKNDTDRE